MQFGRIQEGRSGRGAKAYASLPGEHPAGEDGKDEVESIREGR